jgi:diguanylate cyclase (GGDEF)-like protein
MDDHGGADDVVTRPASLSPGHITLHRVERLPAPDDTGSLTDPSSLPGQVILLSRRLMLVNEIAVQMMARPEPAATLAVLGKYAHQLLPCDMVQVVAGHPPDLAWQLLPTTLPIGSHELTRSTAEPSALPSWLAGGPTADCITNRVLMRLEDVAESGCQLAPLEVEVVRRGARALLVAPLLSNDQPYGAILFWARQAGAFDEEARRTVHLLAPHVANALAVATMVSRIQALTLVDPLTDLANRRHFTERLVKEVAWAQRYGHDISLCLLDIDDFKAVNDARGHHDGDQVLLRLAERLRTSFRATDLACRYGGEEFALILPETSPDKAWRLAERLRQEVASGVLGAHPSGQPITISAGVAGGLDWITQPDDLVRAADAALYQAKRGGRNRTCVAQPYEG